MGRRVDLVAQEASRRPTDMDRGRRAQNSPAEFGLVDVKVAAVDDCVGPALKLVRRLRTR